MRWGATRQRAGASRADDSSAASSNGSGHSPEPTDGGRPSGRGYGAFVARHAKAIVLTWLVAVVLAFATTAGAFGGGGLFAHLQQAEPFVPGEAHTGNDMLLTGDKAGGSVAVRLDGVASSQQAAVGAKVQQVIDDVVHTSAVESAYSPAAKRDPRVAAAYRSSSAPESMVFVATLDAGLDKSVQEDVSAQVTKAVEAVTPAGVRVRTGGSVEVLKRITDQVQEDLKTGEGIAFPLTLIVMVIVFGGFIAAGLPLIGAIAAIAGGLLALLGFSHVTDLDATVVNIVTILGLGLSIDYGLLIVGRFREELSRLALQREADGLDGVLTSADHDLATQRTIATAGRTVLFSGLTVAISVAGLVLFPASVTKAIGLAGLSVVAVACLAALTLVPACARLAAARLAKKRVQPDADEGRFADLAHAVQRHLWISICGVVVVLLVLAAPLLGMRQVSSTSALLPTSDPQRTLMNDLAHDFPVLGEPAVSIVGETDVATMTKWVSSDVAHREYVTGVNPVRDLGDGKVAVGLRVDGATPSNGRTQHVVHDLHAHRPGFPTWVTGQQAKLDDYTHAIAARAPYVVLVVAFATLVLLFLMTGSLVLPLKALLFNALSLGASLGAMTWIFQNGHFESLLGYTSNDAIESTVPVILIAFGFGLAMDYEVFLLSRIVEAHEHGDDDARAVAVGIQRSGRIVTSAALLMVIVMLGFAAAKMVIIKQIGVGLALSIILDATLVRMILVPATMTVMGRWNWWAPAPMKRWHARFGLRD